MRTMAAYEGAVGDRFAASATDGPDNAHTDRPAIFALAATSPARASWTSTAAPGITETPARGAAEVVGVEGSATSLRHAGDQTGRDAAVTRAGTRVAVVGDRTRSTTHAQLGGPLTHLSMVVEGCGRIIVPGGTLRGMEA